AAGETATPAVSPAEAAPAEGEPAPTDIAPTAAITPAEDAASHRDALPTGSTEDAPARAGIVPATTSPHRRGCQGEAGEIVGYWYAGATAPGAAGDTITVPRDVNVRADYPDRHNGYDARAPVRCTLAKGDRITLAADPILVPGDRYWVPLVATGDTSSSTSTP
ncbi:MAG: hypothetical protein D6798_12320, partial [Deltaproteobacteria bacterium]